MGIAFRSAHSNRLGYLAWKAAALRIGIPTTFLRTNKSSSPDTMHATCAATAQVRNMSSSGSRQSLTWFRGWISSIRSCRKVSQWARSAVTFRFATSIRTRSYSHRISGVPTIDSRPWAQARRMARGFPPQNTADTTILVSSTTRTPADLLNRFIHVALLKTGFLREPSGRLRHLLELLHAGSRDGLEHDVGAVSEDHHLGSFLETDKLADIFGDDHLPLGGKTGDSAVIHARTPGKTVLPVYTLSSSSTSPHSSPPHCLL